MQNKIMAKYRVQGKYTYTVFKIVEAINKEQATSIALDDEPLATWDSIEQDSYSEFIESATKEINKGV